MRRPLERIQSEAASQIKQLEGQYRYSLFLLSVSILNWFFCLILTVLIKDMGVRLIIGLILFLGLIITVSLYQEMEVKRKMLVDTKKALQPGVKVMGNIVKFMDKVGRPAQTSYRIPIEDEQEEES